MILQALKNYYDRNEELPRQGWIRRGVDYAIVLDVTGSCIAIDSLGTASKGKTTPLEMLLPSIGKQAMKHTNSGADANFLWDNASFVFGRGNKGSQKLAAFLDAIAHWSGDSPDEGLAAVKQFCKATQQDAGFASQLFKRFQVEADFEKRDPVVIFRLHPDNEGVHAREAVRIAYETKLVEASSGAVVRGNCLVTGASNTPIAANETVIKGVWGAQTSGANIVSFNARAFESYGKKDRGGENAPVSVRASFAYTTTLNHLLRKDSPQRIQVGDASTVFWTDIASDLETVVPDIFGDAPPDDPDAGTRAVQVLLSAVHKEHGLSTQDDGNRFHILGLAPNAARISIRFYYCLRLPELGKRIEQHFKDLEMMRGAHGYDPQYPSLKRLLQTVCLATSSQPFGDIDRLPPNLGGAIVDAIFSGENVPYPALWLNAAVGRCRAEQAKKTQQGTQAQNVPYARAAVIKACLNRQIRRANLSAPDHLFEKEFLPMLDRTNNNPGYLLGRLFAVLERIQEIAAGGGGKLNSTIRDKYYGAMATSPGTVFPTLDKLKTSHLKKLPWGQKEWFDKLLGEILSDLPDIPRQLSLPDQGRFALGYYHQRQDRPPKVIDDSSTPPATPSPIEGASA
jgi:CRISPR-associated protein Csd1